LKAVNLQFLSVSGSSSYIVSICSRSKV